MISCRAADWRGSSGAQDIAQDYGRPVKVLTLQALTEAQAVGMLIAALGRSEAEQFYCGLREQGLQELLHSPQTLKMLLEVAPDGVPHGRGDLFNRATRKMLAEHNNDHAQDELNLLDSATLLDAAGAAMAMLVLTGKDAINIGLQGRTPEHQVNIAEIAALPLAKDVRVVLKSRLFRATDEEFCFADNHRMIAEYLSARWLSRIIDRCKLREQMTRRLFSLIHSRERVPTSARGLHAWLAYWSHWLLPRVVAADPFGAIRYGDLGEIGQSEAASVWSALERWSDDDPWFRAGDWQNFSVASLIQVGMGDLLGTILDNPSNSFHMRSLVLGMLPGAPCVPEMREQLRRITRDGQRTYGERHGALLALSRWNDSGVNWSAVLTELCYAGDSDSLRLAEDILPDIGIARVNNQDIAEVVFALCRKHSRTSDRLGRSERFGEFLGLERIIPLNRCADLLDALVQRFRSSGEPIPNMREHFGFWHFFRSLILRQVPANEIDPIRLWRWLDSFESRWSSDRKLRDRISKWLEGNDKLRRSIQHHVLFSDEGLASRMRRNWSLADLSSGLLFREDDAAVILQDLIVEGRRDDRAFDVFELLVRGWHGQAWTKRLAELAEEYAQADPALMTILHPPPLPDDPENQRLMAEMAEERRVAEEECEARSQSDRLRFEAQIDNLRQGGGDLPELAVAYLGYGEARSCTDAPDQRIGNWVGAKLYDIALEGFEAAIQQPLPWSLHEFSTHLIYRNDEREFAWSIVAGLAERYRSGLGFSGVRDDILIAGLIGKRYALNIVDNHLDGFADALEAKIAENIETWERYLRALLEPQITAQERFLSGVHYLIKAKVFPEISIRLMLEWLDDLCRLDIDIKAIVGALLDAPNSIREVAIARVNSIVADAFAAGLFDENHLFWWSLRFLLDFEGYKSDLADIAHEYPDFLWELQKTVGYSRYGDRELRNVSIEQIAWIFCQFHTLWPAVERPVGTTVGRRHRWDASEFLRSLLFTIAGDVTPTAMQLLHSMTEMKGSTYGEYLRAARARQRAKAADISYTPPTVVSLQAALSEQAPRTAAEVREIVLEALDRLQTRIYGTSTDTCRRYFEGETPLGEESCRNLTLDLLGENLPFGIAWTPEEQMPNRKRADAGFRLGNLRIPLEAKLHWSRELWTSPEAQLDRLYASGDYMSEGLGIYLVFWFGDRVGKQPRRLGGVRPGTADELADMLRNSMSGGLKSRLAVRVLDLSRVQFSDINR